MSVKPKKYAARVIALVALLLAGLGCNLISPTAIPIDFAIGGTATPTGVPPTATIAPPPVPPMSAEAEALNLLEAQVIAVYESVGPAVVNVTNRGYAYDMFMRPVPQEGGGSGARYHVER